MTKVEFIRHFTTVVLFSAFVLTSACRQKETTPTPEPAPVANTDDFLTYSNDGLSLRHPAHWILDYDESPDLFADRGISYKTSEVSYADVLIFHERQISTADVADYYEKSMNLRSSPLIRNYQRKPLQLGGFKGITLSWRNAVLIEYDVELSILQVSDSPKRVFTVFNFDEESLRKDAAHRIPFIESINVE